MVAFLITGRQSYIITQLLFFFGRYKIKKYNKNFLFTFLFLKYKQPPRIMKIASSLKSLKNRDLNSKLVRRRGRIYIINKKNPKFKARQK